MTKKAEETGVAYLICVILSYTNRVPANTIKASVHRKRSRAGKLAAFSRPRRESWCKVSCGSEPIPLSSSYRVNTHISCSIQFDEHACLVNRRCWSYLCNPFLYKQDPSKYDQGVCSQRKIPLLYKQGPSKYNQGICSKKKIPRRKTSSFFTTTLRKLMQGQLRIRTNPAFQQLQSEHTFKLWNHRCMAKHEHLHRLIIPIGLRVVSQKRELAKQTKQQWDSAVDAPRPPSEGEISLGNIVSWETLPAKSTLRAIAKDLYVNGCFLSMKAKTGLCSGCLVPICSCITRCPTEIWVFVSTSPRISGILLQNAFSRMAFAFNSLPIGCRLQ